MDNIAPYTHATLLAELSVVQRDVAEFFDSLALDEFFSRVGAAWSPAEHLAHLNSAVSAVGRGFSLPPWILRLRFGKAGRSRSYAELRDDYRARLAAGGRATGPFVPQPEQGRSDPAERKSQLLERWGRVNHRLRSALAKWSEQNLDRVSMPHPILGKITAREMLLFTIYHGGHHVMAAKGRLPRFAQ